MENKDKIQDEFMEFWEKTDNVGLGKYSDTVTDWWFSKIDLLLKSKQEEIEKVKFIISDGDIKREVVGLEDVTEILK